MDKKTKLYLGIGLLAVATYLVWKQQPKPSVANASGSGGFCKAPLMACKDSNRCYDPRVNYAVDPCKKTTTF